MSQHKRKKFYVDVDVQRALLRRLAFHWMLVFGVTLSALVAIESLRSGMRLSFSELLDEIASRNFALILAIAALAPFLIYDSIRQSHRFCGPMVAFRRALRKLAEGEHVAPIYFRKNDFWQDIAVNFNEVVDQVTELKKAANNAPAGNPAEPEPVEVG